MCVENGIRVLCRSKYYLHACLSYRNFCSPAAIAQKLNHLRGPYLTQRHSLQHGIFSAVSDDFYFPGESSSHAFQRCAYISLHSQRQWWSTIDYVWLFCPSASLLLPSLILLSSTIHISSSKGLFNFEHTSSLMPWIFYAQIQSPFNVDSSRLAALSATSPESPSRRTGALSSRFRCLRSLPLSFICNPHLLTLFSRLFIPTFLWHRPHLFLVSNIFMPIHGFSFCYRPST